MDIEISNFKGISNFKYKSVSSMTILSGINSGGKTSFIQSLLMLKQSYEQGENVNPIVLNGKYTKLGNFKDILNRDEKKINKNIEMKFTLYKNDYTSSLLRRVTSSIIHNNYNFQKDRIAFSNKFNKELEKVEIFFHFNTKMKNEVVLPIKMEYRIYLTSLNKPLILDLKQYRMYNYEITTNSGYFINKRRARNEEEVSMGDHIFQEKELKDKISFNGLSPSCYEYFNESDEEINYRLVKALSEPIIHFLRKISYLGPLRDEPHSLYIKENDIVLDIGNKGEHTGNMFSSNYLNKVEYPSYNEKKELVKSEGTLEEAVNYWIDDVFKLAKKISVIPYKNGSIQEIEILNNKGIKNSLSSVGFGISQILPIIVEGILCKKETTLILEQPEIHLHPRIQSLLFDFFRGLLLCEKKVIIETHSDHLINKMQLRIVEDSEDELLKNINLFFVDNTGDIRHIEINQFGNFDAWPEGFFDQFENNISELLNAQIERRKNVRN